MEKTVRRNEEQHAKLMESINEAIKNVELGDAIIIAHIKTSPTDDPEKTQSQCKIFIGANTREIIHITKTILDETNIPVISLLLPDSREITKSETEEL